MLSNYQMVNIRYLFGADLGQTNRYQEKLSFFKTTREISVKDRKILKLQTENH